MLRHPKPHRPKQTKFWLLYWCDFANLKARPFVDCHVLFHYASQIFRSQFKPCTITPFDSYSDVIQVSFSFCCTVWFSVFPVLLYISLIFSVSYLTKHVMHICVFSVTTDRLHFDRLVKRVHEWQIDFLVMPEDYNKQNGSISFICRKIAINVKKCFQKFVKRRRHRLLRNTKLRCSERSDYPGERPGWATELEVLRETTRRAYDTLLEDMGREDAKGYKLWTLNSELWALNSELWTMNDGLCTLAVHLLIKHTFKFVLFVTRFRMPNINCDLGTTKHDLLNIYTCSTFDYIAHFRFCARGWVILGVNYKL